MSTDITTIDPPRKPTIGQTEPWVGASQRKGEPKTIIEATARDTARATRSDRPTESRNRVRTRPEC